jgi:hypothetical protein
MVVERIVRIFNSLLCLKFITTDRHILLVYYFGIKSKNYDEYVASIEDKFVKKLDEF